MNKQYVEGVHYRKKACLMMVDSKMVISKLVLLFNGRRRDNVSTIQTRGAKEGENGFPRLTCDFPQAHPFLKMIIYCLATSVYQGV